MLKCLRIRSSRRRPLLAYHFFLRRILCSIHRYSLTHSLSQSLRNRYPDPLIKPNDTVKFNLTTGKIESFVSMDVGSLVMITKGRNCGRMGTLVSKEKHPGSFNIAHIKDVAGNSFATRLDNCFRVGSTTAKGEFETMIDMGYLKGKKLTIIQEQEKRMKKSA